MRTPTAADVIPTIWTSYPKDAPSRRLFRARASGAVPCHAQQSVCVQHRTQYKTLLSRSSEWTVKSVCSLQPHAQHTSVSTARQNSHEEKLSASTRVRRDQTLSASGHIRFNFGDLSDSELFYNTFGLPRSNS